MALIGDLPRVWRFVHELTGWALASDMKAIGLERGGELVAGALYQNCNGSNIWMHIGILPGAHVTPTFARYVFEYPFDELGVKRITGWIDAENVRSRRLAEHCGFQQEFRVRGAAEAGGDAILYVMRREHCRPLLRRSRADASMAR